MVARQAARLEIPSLLVMPQPARLILRERGDRDVLIIGYGEVRERGDRDVLIIGYGEVRERGDRDVLIIGYGEVREI